MERLEQIWEYLTLFFGGILRGFERAITSLFGSSNARMVKKMQSKVDAITSLEPKYKALSDEELKEQTNKFRERLQQGETPDDILVEAFAVCREAGRRFLNMRHYDVQMVGGMVLHSGAVGEMVTGEGKTLVATLPAYLNAISGKGVHVVTVNDYLARRDMEWMAPIYMNLGLTVGAIQSDMKALDRQKAYACDITYGTNNEFGFDYLRDNMRPAARGDDRYPKNRQQSQGKLNFAIVDEVDNILIDEARTPLIISGPAHQDVGKYMEADKIARKLRKEVHFAVNEKDHNVSLTDEGVREAERLAGVDTFYTAGNMDWPHMIDNSLKAHYLYKKDVNYVVKDGKVIIVDEFTGRLMDGRQWSDGLHQAVEAKEGVKIKEETQTLATITLQNYFKLYQKICGMTGTAMTEANEFFKIYQLDVVAIPTNRPMQRLEYPDTIYSSEKFKWKAVADEIEKVHRWDVVTVKSGEEFVGNIKSADDDQVVVAEQLNGTQHTIDRSKVTKLSFKGRPILVGTTSIEKSELISGMLERRGIQHEVLNAKNHKREAEIVAQAGRLNAVTIATNMAGRGTDIVLGGNPETAAWAQLQDTYETRLDVPDHEWEELVKEIDKRENMSTMGEEVKKIGGLHVIGTERHEARRIDLQLRGRCGRQGDPGSSRFYLSLDDDLMRIFAGGFVKRMLEFGGFKDDMPLESTMVSRRIDGAQKKREEFNFEIRKNLLEYDEVMDEQRKRVYSFRQQILDGYSCREIIVGMIRDVVETNLRTLLARDYGTESFARFAGDRLSTKFEPRIFRNLDAKTADEVAKDEAQRNAESEILALIEENLPVDEENDQSDWNWDALARVCNARWDFNIRERDLKKIGRDRIDEHLIGKAEESIQKIDLSEGHPMLDEDFGCKMASAWIAAKFGFNVDPAEFKDKEAHEVVDSIENLASKKYDEKEAEYPVMAGMYKFAEGGPNSRIDREGLVEWASSRFEKDISMNDLRNKQRDEIRALLVERSREHQNDARQKLEQVHQKVASLSKNGDVPLANGNGAGVSLKNWMEKTVNCEVDAEQINQLEAEELEQKLESIVEDRYHPEMRKMERLVLLEIVDSGWKDHLLAMDHLRSAVGQRGMAQLDPKVEYKREGMRMFDQLWKSIGERVTDLIFRMEQLDEGFVHDTIEVTAELHEQAPQASELAMEQEAAIEGSHQNKVETIRNRGAKLGRNDPCHCGSGKKYKNCHLRMDREAS
jgi:preprotein translocase subunit SecA